MKRKKILSGLIGAVIAVSATVSMISTTVSAEDSQNDAFVDLNQSQITEAMGAGWNLGNQLEAVDTNGVPNETAYGNPVIKKELLHAVKLAGFKSVRIPISYLSKIGAAPNYTIDADWLARIKEVVDYCVDEGLYAIINMHGDGYNSVQGGWLLCNAPDEKQPEIKAKYAACWEQIATLFKDYDEHLIFESMNEEFDGVTYGGNVNKTYYSNINAYNQIFVDTVRKTGGNNAKRWILIPGWNTNIDLTVGNYGFALPTDTNRDSSIPASEQRIMISVHYYDPWDFSGDGTSGTYSQWGSDSNPQKAASYSNTEEYMEGQIEKVYDKFVNAGYPVVIGEYGCINKSATDPANTIFRAHYDKTMCELSKKYGCIPVYWDNGAVDNSFGLFNRNTYEIEQPEIIDAMMEAFLTPEENVNRYITKISSLDGNSYTSETWTPLNDALTTAKDLVESGSATDDQLLDAYNKLYEAFYKLMPSENYLKDQVVVTDKDTADSDTIEASDGLIKNVEPSVLDVVSSKRITLKFKIVSGTPSADDNLFVFKPFSNNKWNGWTDNFVKFSDVGEPDPETGEYTVTLDPQKILQSYVNGDFSQAEPDPAGANSINIYYTTKGTSTNIQLTYCSFAFTITHTRHHYEYSDEKAPSCTENGNKVYICTACGETYNEEIKSTGHNWGSWQTIKEATCTEDGIEEHTCSICSEKEQRTISAKGHSFTNGVCTVCHTKDPNYVPPTSGTVTTTATTKATRSPKAVKNDKKKAKKLMKQAKITTLNVKSKAKKKINVTWKKVKKAKGYEVQVSTNKKFKKSKIIFKKDLKKVKLTIKNKKIKSKKTYYVRVRAYATYKDKNNVVQKVYSAWNKKLRKVKVK